MLDGVLLVATGHPYYGEMAYNLLKSIRYNSDIDIAIVATKEALHTTKERDFQLIEIPNPESIGKLKTELIDLSPFDRTIYIDADSLICPGKDIRDFLNVENPLKIPYLKLIDTKTTPGNYNHWVNFSYLKEHYNIQIPQMPGEYQSSVITFDKSETSKEFFKAAQRAFQLMKEHFGTIGGWYKTVPDEACFWAATVETGYFPEHNLYPHIYFGWGAQSANRGHILKHHHLVTFPSAQNVLAQTSKYLYNDLSNFYASKLGKKGYQWKDKGTFRLQGIKR